MKLIPVSQHVINLFHKFSHNGLEYLMRTFQYAKFSQQPINPGMFATSLNKPTEYQAWLNKEQPTSTVLAVECLKYHQAVTNIIFEGFTLVKDIENTEANPAISIDGTWLDIRQGNQTICVNLGTDEPNPKFTIEDLTNFDITIKPQFSKNF